MLFCVMLIFYGRKELLFEATFGFAFLWTTKKSWTRCLTTANKPFGVRALRCPTQDNKRRTTVRTPGSGTVPKNCECWWMKLSTQILNDCELMSNCIPEFQQIIYIPECHSSVCQCWGPTWYLDKLYLGWWKLLNCLLFILWISEFIVNWFLLLITKCNKESTYWEGKGNIFNFLNKCQHDSLFFTAHHNTNYILVHSKNFYTMKCFVKV
jgi:hypothetical protein